MYTYGSKPYQIKVNQLVKWIHLMKIGHTKMSCRRSLHVYMHNVLCKIDVQVRECLANFLFEVPSIVQSETLAFGRYK